MSLKKVSNIGGFIQWLYLVGLYCWRALVPLWRWFYFLTLNRKIPLSALKRHGYIVAGTKSGKTEFIKTLILRHISRWGRNETVFFIEPHGDCSEEIARFKTHTKGQGRELVYLSTALCSQHTFCINPLDLGAGRNNAKLVSFMAEHLTTAFQELITDSKISANMRAFLTPILSVLLKRPNSTFLDFRRFLDDEQNADLLEYAQNNCSKGQKDFFYTKFNSRTYAATKNALYIKIQELLNYESFYRLTIGKSTVNVKELMESGKTVLFGLSKSDGAIAVKAFGRLLVSMIQGYGFCRQDTIISNRRPVYIYIDEMQNFVSDAIGEILEELRKYGIHVVLCHQHLKQIKSTDLKESILTNAAVKVTGAVSGDSLTTIQKIMTGASKEYIEGLEQGRFLVKVKPDTIWQRVFFRYAFPLRVTTSYLGNRYAMKAKEWGRVKALQIKNHYKPLTARQSDEKRIQQESYQENYKTPEIENFRASQPFVPRY